MTPVEEIKERLSIEDVVGSYIKLEKAGAQYKANCPFHNEKTPSFFVSPSRGSFYCFGCNVGGDIFTFVEKIEGIDFRETLKTLADRAGVTLTAVRTADETPLLQVIEAAALFFETELERNNEAKLYLKERGFFPETVKSFRLGYAPDDWRLLTKHLTKLGFDEGLQKRSGLVIESEKGLYDRFRSRIMFPLSNSSGKIVGFSGRILPSKAKENESLGKYVNSPETELYHKSRILFGYDRARRAIQERNLAVIVEGHMDLCLAQQAGTVNTVAVSGTALTGEHLALLKRFTKNVAFCLDNDAAGFEALKRSSSIALLSGMDVRVVPLLEKDPADTIRANPDEWHKSLGQAEHIIVFLLKALKKKAADDREYGKLVGETVVPLLALIPNAIDQSHFVREVAEALKIPEESIRTELRKVHRVQPKEEVPIEKEGKKRAARIVEKILGLSFLKAGNVKDIPKEISEKISDWEADPALLPDFPEEVRKKLLFEAEMYASPGAELEKEMKLLYLFLEEEVLRERLEKITMGIKEKEKEKKDASEEMSLYHKFSKRMHEIKEELRGRPLPA